MIENGIQWFKQQGHTRSFGTRGKSNETVNNTYNFLFRSIIWSWCGAAIIIKNITKHHDVAAVHLARGVEHVVHFFD